MVNKGNHPLVALLQVSEIFQFTQIDDTEPLSTWGYEEIYFYMDI